MTTTFQSRELIRDELVALFVANGSWQNVYGYRPPITEFKGKTPLLTIRSGGTEQDMAGLDLNPTSHSFLISSYVLAYSAADSWTSAMAEDKLDELGQLVRQVIRNNTGTLTNADLLRFAPAGSQIVDIEIQSVPYIRESREIFADLKKGTML